MKNLGEQIYFYRRKCGLSQLDIAEKLEVSRQSVSKWENGAATPELEKVVKLAELFEISINEFLGMDTASEKEPKAINSADSQIVITIKKPSFRRRTKDTHAKLSPKKIMGLGILIIGILFLLIMNLFFWHNDGFSTFLWGILFLSCAAIFFFESKHCILFCTWASWIWTYSFFCIGQNTPFRAITITIVLVAVTLFYFWKTPSFSPPKTLKPLAIGAICSAVLFFPLRIGATRLAHLLLPALGKIKDSYLAFSLTCLAFDLKSLAEISVITVFIFSIAPLFRLLLDYIKKTKCA